MTFRSMFAAGAAALGLLGLASEAAAGVVYSQAGDGQACSPQCWTSDIGSADNYGFQTFDNFTLSKSAGITTVSWQGFYYDYVNLANDPVAPVTNNWQIQFYGDSAGLPGALLYTTTETAAQVTTTLLDQDTPFLAAANVYEFTAVLPTAFAASAGTPYWFSPLSLQTDFNPFFSWSAAASQPSGAYSAQLFEGALSAVSGDRAFTLSSVPEPAAWSLMLVSFAGMGAALRVRRGRLAAAV